jgi:CheY-like chemotaxis protein
MAELPFILVAEDNGLLRTLVEETLSDAGFAAALVASGEEALALLTGHSGKYRALVTDINLSGKIDGWEVAHRAREIDPAFPIVYMSGAQAEHWAPKESPTASYWQSPSRQRSS